MEQCRDSATAGESVEWSQPENIALTEMIHSGQTFHSMCKKLKRTPLSIAMAVLLEKDPIENPIEMPLRGLPKSQTSI